MDERVCFESYDGDWVIRLIQTGFDLFTVVYGKQIKKNLYYSKAATELGSCLMHRLALDGKLDNRTKLEAKKDGDTEPQFETTR